MKKRADQLVVEQGLCESRTQAQRLIQAGQVRIGDDQVVNKPGALLPEETVLQVLEPCPYVSRGAYKLVNALDLFSPPLAGMVALDVGASTGGFTDLLLQRGVRQVFAIDVGYGQLHFKLREDPRVVNIERTNARHLSREQVPDPVDLLVSDVSFISLTKVLPACAPLIKPGGWVFVLVKPQFEAKREEIGKNGVVRDEVVQRRCVEEVAGFAEREFGWRRLGVVESPIKGPKGNQEYIVAFRTPEAGSAS
jgi:23S rRNA (cytidine1920-2'-O)/16S rRNA (cytidine1409-2'-O)-methyltransferase